MTASGSKVTTGLRPIFKIEIDGQDVTKTIGDRLISLRTTDYSGQQTDTVELSIDDRDVRIEPPPDGATMSVAVGYEGQELKLIGAFLVDEVEFGNGPRGMTIKGLGIAPGGDPEGLGRGAGETSTGQAKTVTASWYGPGFIGNLTANGERFTAREQTAAHKTLPFGTRVRVTNPSTGQSTVVRINDRGPFVGGRELDLSQAAAEKIGLLSSGVASITMDVLGQPGAKPGAPPAPVLPPPAVARGGAGPRELIKFRRSESWHDTTLLEIARKIAGRNGLALEIKGALPKIQIRHEDQTNESDAAFLTRLAQRFGLVIKPADGRLVVTPRGAGELGPNVTIKQPQVTTWSAQTKERARYKKVRAKWLDRKSRKEKVVTVTAKESAEGSQFELAELFRDEEEARQAATAQLQGLTSGVVGVNITMPGAPLLAAEGTITLEGFRAEIDGQPWIVRSVSHSIDGRGGFSTSVDAGTKEVEVESGSGGGAAPGAGGASANRIANAASQSVGMSTTSSGLGRNPCLWSVNRVLARAGVTPPWGGSNYVPTAREALANGGGTLLSGPEPGAIAIMRDNGSPPYPHVGIVLENGQIASSSSDRQRFDWVAPESNYTNRYGRTPEYWRLK